MSDQAASEIVKRALISPVTAFAMAGGLVSAGVGASVTYLSLQNSMERLADKVIVLEVKDRDRDAGIRQLTTDLNQRVGGIEKSIAGIETSVRFLADAQRRRNNE